MKSFKIRCGKYNQTTFLLHVFLYLSTSIIYAQSQLNTITPKVDERVELMSIINQLTDIEKFSDSLNPDYAEAIYHHFKKYAGHPAVSCMQKFKDSMLAKGIEAGDWELASFAVHLSAAPDFKPLVSFAVPETADGWDDRSLFKADFVKLVKQFYKEADCGTFFKSMRSYYRQVNEGYGKQGQNINEAWVRQFFGLQATENYYPIIALCMPAGAYLRVNFKNNRRNTYTIFGCTAFDQQGIPVNFSNSVYPRSMLHEYIHVFSNQLVDKNMDALRQSAETLLNNPRVHPLVENTFYGNWQFLLYESLVRASSIQYMQFNKGITADIEREFTTQEKAGFLWMRELVAALNEYDTNRKKYPTLASYMPRLIQFFNNTAEGYK